MVPQNVLCLIRPDCLCVGVVYSWHHTLCTSTVWFTVGATKCLCVPCPGCVLVWFTAGATTFCVFLVLIVCKCGLQLAPHTTHLKYAPQLRSSTTHLNYTPTVWFTVGATLRTSMFVTKLPSVKSVRSTAPGKAPLSTTTCGSHFRKQLILERAQYVWQSF